MLEYYRLLINPAKRGREPHDVTSVAEEPRAQHRGRTGNTSGRGDACFRSAVERDLPGAGRMVLARGNGIRKRDRHQGRIDVERLRRVVRADRGRKSQSQVGRLVRRNGRSTFAGGGTRPAR